MSSKDYFAAVANQWDTMRRDFFSETVRVKAIEKVDPQPGTSAADLGAGTGFITAGLIEREITVYAIDQSPEMLRILQEKYPAPETIHCLEGSAENLPLADQTVDNSFANMYLHHVENPASAIKEMFRILKPGGQAVITDLDQHDFRFLLEEHNDRWPGFERKQVEQWLNAAGFKQVTIDCINQNCCASSANKTENAEISIFIASGCKP